MITTRPAPPASQVPVVGDGPSLPAGGGVPTPAESAISDAVLAAARVDRRVWLGAAVLAIAGLLLAAGVPASTLLTFGLLFGCVGMHLFMGHGGHGDHVGHGGHPEPAEPERDEARPHVAHAGHAPVGSEGD